MNRSPEYRHRHAVIASCVLAGVGLGGFIDGIVFHQILQTHSMLSARVPMDTVEGMEKNMLADGLFHAFTLLVTIVAFLLLFRSGGQHAPGVRARVLPGGFLLGWGLFNLVEGVINHHVLHTHHVVERLGVSVYDWLFLASGVALAAIGLVLLAGRRGRESPPRARA